MLNKAFAFSVALSLFSPAVFGANAEKGGKLYKKCIQCHGKNGEGKKAQKAPKLSGQYDWYITKQLVNMKKGERINKVMNPYLKNLDKNDFEDLAAYIKTLK